MNPHTPNAPLYIVAGPTASGKSALAIALAKELDGEIINIDSVQLYKDFVIGSASITSSETDGIIHHLVGIRDPRNAMNAKEFSVMVDEAISAIRVREKTVVVVGGTGLYVTAVLHGLADLPETDDKTRALLEERTTESIRLELERVDPVTAGKLHPNDRQRQMRALEIFLLSGFPQSALQAQQESESRYQALILSLCFPRHVLYERINRRAQAMIDAGLLEETQMLVARYGEGCKPLESLGYAQALQCLKGELDTVELLEELAQQTRRFAKRQMTFWRNEPVKRQWRVRPGPDESGIELIDQVVGRQSVKHSTVRQCSLPELCLAVQRWRPASETPIEVWNLDGQLLANGAEPIEK